jgi:hypothetical protein
MCAVFPMCYCYCVELCSIVMVLSFVCCVLFFLDVIHSTLLAVSLLVLARPIALLFSHVFHVCFVVTAPSVEVTSHVDITSHVFLCLVSPLLSLLMLHYLLLLKTISYYC